MKRIALTLGMIAAAAAGFVTMAGADGTHTYQAELFNAFGLVKGSELRIAGAKAGSITGLDITPQKTALVTFEVNSGFPEFKADASCSSEPQSLIAEYFLNCQPGSAAQPLNGPIPAARNKTTVQPDLAQNTLREPFKERLALLINEFGTALAGNSENLNAAIRSGAPALQQLKQALNILGRQNRTIAELNTNSDAIFQQLADRRQDVVNFIDNAGRTSAISAERSNDLSANFDKLDDFLFQLKPVMFQLGKLAENQTPLLTDLHAMAPGLNKLAKHLPAFNEGTRQSLLSLNDAAAPGKVALSNSREEIAALSQASTKAYPAGNILAKFLESIDDPRAAVEEDSCARWDLRQQPGEADHRVQLLDQHLGTTLHGDQTAQCPWATGTPGTNPSGGNPGYTGMEGLLNYAYIQANSLNIFDQLGHALHFTLINAPGSNPCANFQSGVEGVPKEGGGTTFNPTDFAQCAAILGKNQPGITYGQHNQSNGYSPSDENNPASGYGLFGNLKPYSHAVCPNGSYQLSICDPNSARSTLSTSAAAPAEPQAANPQDPGADPNQIEKIKKIIDGLKPGELPQDIQKQLPQLLPPVQVPGGGAAPNSTAPAPSGSATNSLLNFLLGQ